MTDKAIIRWRAEACGHCGAPMAATLLMLVVSYRRSDDGIAFQDPPVVKVCSRTCLVEWLNARAVAT